MTNKDTTLTLDIEKLKNHLRYQPNSFKTKVYMAFNKLSSETYDSPYDDPDLESKYLTVKQVADKLGVPSGTVSHAVTHLREHGAISYFPGSHQKNAKYIRHNIGNFHIPPQPPLKVYGKTLDEQLKRQLDKQKQLELPQRVYEKTLDEQLELQFDITKNVTLVERKLTIANLFTEIRDIDKYRAEKLDELESEFIMFCRQKTEDINMKEAFDNFIEQYQKQLNEQHKEH